MNEQQITDLMEKVIDERMKKFRRWDPIDGATDQFSPITGASTQIGFFGTPKVSKLTVTGAKGGNAALTSLCSVLAGYGLITNSTT